MIQLDQLSKRYGDPAGPRWGEPERAAGCLYGLLGPEWRWQDHLCGFSALLAPDAGSVQVLASMPWPIRVRREQLGYVAQEVAIDKILSGRELLQLQASLYHLDPPRVAAALMSSLSSSAWASGSIAAAAPIPVACAGVWIWPAGCCSPAVLVLDEPTVGLDIESRAALWQVLQQLRDDGTTVLLSSRTRRGRCPGGPPGHPRWRPRDRRGTPESLKRDRWGSRHASAVGNSYTPKSSKRRACCSN